MVQSESGWTDLTNFLLFGWYCVPEFPVGIRAVPTDSAQKTWGTDKTSNSLESLKFKDLGKATWYTIYFNFNAWKTSWNEQALFCQFYKGLPDQLKDEIACISKPAWLKALQNLVATFNQYYWECQLETNKNKKASNTTSSSTSNSNSANKSTSSNNCCSCYRPGKGVGSPLLTPLLEGCGMSSSEVEEVCLNAAALKDPDSLHTPISFVSLSNLNSSGLVNSSLSLCFIDQKIHSWQFHSDLFSSNSYFMLIKWPIVEAANISIRFWWHYTFGVLCYFAGLHFCICFWSQLAIPLQSVDWLNSWSITLFLKPSAFHSNASLFRTKWVTQPACSEFFYLCLPCLLIWLHHIYSYPFCLWLHQCLQFLCPNWTHRPLQHSRRIPQIPGRLQENNSWKLRTALFLRPQDQSRGECSTADWKNISALRDWTQGAPEVSRWKP